MSPGFNSRAPNLQKEAAQLKFCKKVEKVEEPETEPSVGPGCEIAPPAGLKLFMPGQDLKWEGGLFLSAPHAPLHDLGFKS